MNADAIAWAEQATVAAALPVPYLMVWATEWFGIEFGVESISGEWYECRLNWPDGHSATWYGDESDIADAEHWLRFIAPDTLE